ncbi:hypothetical protein CANCADRAFT_51022 [Tortispora caseinolytica NRRL Y-17796]|uniref:TOG domain-containing protein n=1 Tax=Tortispora caseinolytica NRRL Y-17796 TaxID=767744 RepID=A0A1E4TG74_9ASCO|nr:hypothetical protein CANCADRAFT_51022 [Tortispora caseinolytica NRRL Y-17796]
MGLEVAGTELLSDARATMGTSSVSRRLEFFSNLSSQVHVLNTIETRDLIDLLFTTYPIYLDIKSRNAVLSSMSSILDQSPIDALAYVTKKLQQLSTDKVSAQADSFVLLEWSLSILTFASSRKEFNKSDVSPLLRVASIWLQRSLNGNKHKISVSASKSAKSALSKILLDINGPEFLSVALNDLTSPSADISSLVFIDAIAAAVAQLTERPDLLEIVSAHKSHIIATFYNIVLSTKNILELSQSPYLTSFSEHFIETSDINTEFVSLLERSLLRSPEVVLPKIKDHGLIASILNATSSAVDLSAIASADKVISSLLSAANSSKQEVRTGSTDLLSLIVAKSTSVEALQGIITKTISFLKSLKASAVEEKCSIAGVMLLCCPGTAVSSHIIAQLKPILQKESNESVVDVFCQVFIPHFFFTIDNNATPDGLLNFMSDSLTKSKPGLKYVWIRNICTFLYRQSSFLSDNALNFISTNYELFKEVLAQTQSNPSQAFQNGFLTTAYAIVSLFLVIKRSKPDFALPDDYISELYSSSDSFLYNEKAYARITSISDLSYLVSVLVEILSLSKGYSYFTEEAQVKYIDAWLFISCCPYFPGALVKNVFLDLHWSCSVYFSRNKEFLLGMLSGCYRWLGYGVTSADVSSKVLEICGPKFPKFQDILRSLLYSSALDKSFVEKLLVRSALLLHHKMVPTRHSWIDFCLAVKVDPKSLVDVNEKVFKAQIIEFLNLQDPLFVQAASDLLSTLCFISPESFAPFACTTITSLPIDLSGLSDLDIVIWRAEPGPLPVVDVLKSNEYSHRPVSGTDRETALWEEQVRRDIAKKSNTSKKLTKEEHAKVQEQLEKENEIRNSVQSLYKNCFIALSVIDSLSKGVNNGENIWYPTLIPFIVSLLNADADKILDNKLSALYTSLSHFCSPRISDLRPVIGSVIMKCMNIHGKYLDFSDISVHELVLKILHRVRFLSEQAMFDLLTFSYILPLLFYIIEKGGSGVKDSETVNEQLILCFDNLSFHSGLFSEEEMPRLTCLKLLQQSYQKYTHLSKDIRNCIVGICQAISPNISLSETGSLLDMSISPDAASRSLALEIIDAEMTLEMPYSFQIWVDMFDSIELNKLHASQIWEENEMKVASDIISPIVALLAREDDGIRLAAAKSIGKALSLLDDPTLTSKIVDELFELYNDDIKASKRDPRAFVKASDIKKENWRVRHGVALALKYIVDCMSGSDVLKVLKFLIEGGASGDSVVQVRKAMQAVGTECVQVHGLHYVAEMISLFENYLNSTHGNTATDDFIHTAVIVYYGCLAWNFKKGDSRIQPIVSRLLDTAATPSEEVQYAVATCLPPLIESLKPLDASLTDRLFDEIFNGKSYAQIRGSAYALAGIVKGLGLSSFASLKIVSRIEEGISNKRSTTAREGSMVLIECLSIILGRIMEPYVVILLPHILTALGDMSPQVRQASNDATMAIMQNTTIYGVKLIIPIALNQLRDDHWRATKGAVELLGSMAYLNPAQLSRSLSSIIPEIVSVLNDSHKEIRSSANAALSKFGDSITNPEIHSIASILIDAISDPIRNTDKALDALISMKFDHFIDAPSLALVMHIIHRALHERSSSSKQKASKIVGNMTILTDPHDLIPYLHDLISDLQSVIVDPVPATRATASRALGSLAEKFGEEQIPQLIPQLLGILQNSNSQTDRLGAAQGLAEVVYGLGVGKLDEILPSVLQSTTSPDPNVRDGFASLLIFFPAAFGNIFSTYLSRVIPCVLARLADDVDTIRETAMRAGRLIVKNYAAKSIDLLLPELEKGLSNHSFRIRLSSVELTGELLFQCAGVVRKTDVDEEQDEDDIIYNNFQAKLIEALGIERWQRILSALYMCRSDTSGQVRSSSLAVWKSLVVNTPKTVKEILPVLSQMVVRRLSDSNIEQKSIAAGVLGDLVRRVGDLVLSQMLPAFERSIAEGEQANEGVCIALREIIESTSVEDIRPYEGQLIRIVQNALSDSDELTREAAASTFDVLQDKLGSTAVDHVVPELLSQFSGSDEDKSHNALSALKEILLANSSVFPSVASSLITPPITSFNAYALGALAPVVGRDLSKKLTSIINALVDALIGKPDAETEEALSNAFDSVILAVDDSQGPNTLMQLLLGLARSDVKAKRIIVFDHMEQFFENSTLNYSNYISDWISECLMVFNDSEEKLVAASWKAMRALTSNMTKEQLQNHSVETQHILSSSYLKSEEIAGLCRPKGPSAVLPIFLQGLMFGSNTEREASARGISEIVDHTSPEYLKPFVTQMTGPLIRIVGERFATDVKVAIIQALDLLLLKVPQFLKPFFPQLQRTFVRSLTDIGNESLRLEAATALGSLIESQPRVDPLISELCQTYKSTLDTSVRAAIMRSLVQIVSKGGGNMSATSQITVLELARSSGKAAKGRSAVDSAILVGHLLQVLPSDEAERLISSEILVGTSDVDNMSYTEILTLNSIIKYAGSSISSSDMLAVLSNIITKGILSTSPLISDNSVVAAGKLLLSDKFELSFEQRKNLISALASAITSPPSASTDTRRLSLVTIRTVSRLRIDYVKPHMNELAPAVYASVRDTVIPIKLAAEKCFLALFQMSEYGDKQLTKWLESIKDIQPPLLPNQRSITDYTRRIAMRLVEAEKDRIEAGGDAEAVYADRLEDEAEIWAIGGIEN